MGNTIKTTRDTVTGLHLQATIKKELVKRYGSVYKFCNSQTVRAWKVSPTAAQNFLSGSKVLSYPFLKRVALHLGFGTLQKHTVIIKTVSYYYEQDNKNPVGRASKKSARKNKS